MGNRIAVTLIGLMAAVGATTCSAQAAETRAALSSKLQLAGAKVHVAANGAPRFIQTPAGSAIPLATPPAQATPEGIARAAMKEYGPLFRITNTDTQLKTLRVASEKGRSVARFQQLHRGIPVIGGEVAVNLRGEEVTAIHGETAPKLALDTVPAIDMESARVTALNAVAKWHRVGAQELKVTKPELSVYVPSLIGPGDSQGQLVWRMEVTSADAKPIREFILINAATGAIALHFNQVDTALSRTTYTAGGTPSMTGTLVCDESDPTCAAGDADAQAAHQYAGDTYNFYWTHHGRNSIDNAGMTIRSVVHYYDAAECPNAFWYNNQMTYCDGLPLADDVVAHELTHGVTEYTSALYYYYQSGAINESFSDVWGEFVDQTNGLGDDTPEVKWLMGEDVPSLGVIRSMKDPTVYGDPDRMTSANYYTGSSDEGGVHSNSGVNNKAVYLMVDGGTFNGRTITGIGISKVAAIYYRVQTAYLTSGADYQDLYLALQQACTDLTGGAEGITADDCTQVTLAAEAVEMNLQPTDGFNPEAAVCPSGTAVTVFEDNLESQSGWTRDSRWDYTMGYATSGTISLYGDDSFVLTDSSVAMDSSVTLPANSYLWFSHAFAFEADAAYYDGGVVEYSTDGGGSWNPVTSSMIVDGKRHDGTIFDGYDNPLAGREGFVGSSHGYVSTRVNLNGLAGSDVRFRWRIATDSSVSTLGWLVDDVKIYSCTYVAGQPAAPSNLTATARSASRIDLAWSDNSADESGFRIYRSLGTGSYSAIATVGVNVTSYSDTGLSKETTYHYYVVAYDAVESGESNPASATTAAHSGGGGALDWLGFTALGISAARRFSGCASSACRTRRSRAEARSYK